MFNYIDMYNFCLQNKEDQHKEWEEKTQNKTIVTHITKLTKDWNLENKKCSAYKTIQ